MILKRFIRFTKESSIRSQIFFSVILNSLISIAVILFMASLFSKLMDEIPLKQILILIIISNSFLSQNQRWKPM